MSGRLTVEQAVIVTAYTGKLIAPWTPKAIASGDLMKHLGDVEGVVIGTPVGKPHGRIGVAYTLRVTKHRPGRRQKPRYIDLSITPRQGDW